MKATLDLVFVPRAGAYCRIVPEQTQTSRCLRDDCKWTESMICESFVRRYFGIYDEMMLNPPKIVATFDTEPFEGSTRIPLTFYPDDPDHDGDPEDVLYYSTCFNDWAETFQSLSNWLMVTLKLDPDCDIYIQLLQQSPQQPTTQQERTETDEKES